MRKPPTIPSQWLINNLPGEPVQVVAGFMNILLFWLDKGKPERPLDAKMKATSMLPSSGWTMYGEHIKRLFDEFYEPMHNHWQHRKLVNDKMSLVANHANNVYAEKRRKEKKQKLSEKNESESLSFLPHKLDKKNISDWQNNGKTDQTIRQEAITRIKKNVDDNFKPGLKDT